MTWNTPCGERILGGKEAKLFAHAIACMLDIAADLDYELGNKSTPFEKLSVAQQYTVLEEVTRALLMPTPTCPELAAVNESAIYFVFTWILENFGDVEVGEVSWGKKVLETLTEVGIGPETEEDEEGGFWPRMGCLSYDAWKNAIDSLADRILWDRDFEMEGQLAGGANVALMRHMRIDLGYFRPYNGHVSPGARDRLYAMARGVGDVRDADADAKKGDDSPGPFSPRAEPGSQGGRRGDVSGSSSPVSD